ncbi:hypothetical protein LJC42_08190 [Eubacteriales bacterium OttesenSCG-928-K08]|nr:hypothetical protein [Eubacteriales bacterium OttesenSCG-928-K08]
MLHPEAEKLHSSLMDNGYDSLANKIAQEMRLSLDADAAAREKWMHITLGELERYMDEETVKKIRKGCVFAKRRNQNTRIQRGL